MYVKMTTYHEKDILTYAVLGNKNLFLWQSTYDHQQLGKVTVGVGSVCNFRGLPKLMLVCVITVYTNAHKYIV